MKTRLLIVFFVGILVSVSISYVWAQEIPWNHYDKQLAKLLAGKIIKVYPKFSK